MTQYTTTVPCIITYTHNPAEKESAIEPQVYEEFTIDKMTAFDVDLVPLFEDIHWDKLDNIVYKYLKGKQ